VSTLRFPSRPLGTVQELERATRDLVSQLERRVINNMSVEIDRTALAHGMSTTPSMVHVIAHSNAHVWQCAAPDSKCVYLQADAPCVVDVEVIP